MNEIDVHCRVPLQDDFCTIWRAWYILIHLHTHTHTYSKKKKKNALIYLQAIMAGNAFLTAVCF